MYTSTVFSLAKQTVGTESITTYYALGTSSTEPPSDPETDISLWSVDNPCTSDDYDTTKYLWVATLIVYTDGSTAWTGLACLTDEATRKDISTLQTAFEVINGQITAKVWQTDIQEAVEDVNTTINTKVSELTETLDGITANVESLSTTATSLVNQYGRLTIATDSITTAVGEAMVNLSSELIASGSFEGYTTFGTNYDWYRNLASTYQAVSEYLSLSCLATKMSTATSSNRFIRQKVTMEAGTYLLRLYLACDEDLTEDVSVEVYASSSILVASGSLANAEYSATVAAAGTITEKWQLFTVTLEFEDDYQYIYLNVPPVTSGSDSYVYMTGISLYNTNSFSSYVGSQITQLKDSLTLSVTSSDTGTATIKLMADDSELGTAEAVTNARLAVQNESTAIEISAGTIAFVSNTLVVDSDQFKLDDSGNATFSGKLTAATGTFAGELSAATGTFSGELTAATGTFAGELSAATGSFSGMVSMTSGMVYNALDLGGYMTVYKDYITNGDFADGSYSIGSTKGDEYWYYNTAYTSVEEYDGLNCLKTYSTSLTSAISNGYIRKYPTTAWESDVTYLIKAKIASTSSTAVVRARFGSATSPSNGNYEDLNKAGELTEKWQNFSCLITTTSSYNYFYLNPIYSNSSDPVYITDIQVSRLDEPTGRIGYMAGATSYSDTDGIGLMHYDRANYVIATSAGTRIQAGNSCLYATEDGINLRVNGNQYTPYYTAGNSVTVSVHTAGYITNGGYDLYCTIPMTKPFVGVSSVTVDSIGVCVRQGDAYCYGSSASANVTPATTTVTASNVGLRLCCTFDNITNVINNSPTGIYVSMTVTLS